MWGPLHLGALLRSTLRTAQQSARATSRRGTRSVGAAASTSRLHVVRPWRWALASGAAAAGAVVLAADGDALSDGGSRFGGFRSSRFADLPSMVEAVMPSVCKLQGAVGEHRLGGGSAFVITADGLIVTNDHVFTAIRGAGAQEIHAIFDDGRAFRVEHIASDAEADIAVGRLLAPAGTRFAPLRLGASGALRRGDLVCVLGAPLGGSLVPTTGTLSGVRYVADDEVMNQVLNSRADWCLLQVDAAMASGSSGGPIVNADGDVVGVSVMVQAAAGGGGVGFVNFGVAIDQAEPIIRALVARGAVRRAAIGMTIVAVDALAAEREAAASGVALLPRGGGHATGLLVTFVAPGKPAAAAGLREGDVLLEVNGRPLTRKGDYFAALGPVYAPGHALECKVFRPAAPPAPPAVAGTRPAPGLGGDVLTVTIVPTVREEVVPVTVRGWLRRARAS